MSITVFSSVVGTLLTCVLRLCASSQLFACCNRMTALAAVLVMVAAVTSSSSPPPRPQPSPPPPPTPDSRCRRDSGLVADEAWCGGFLLCLQGKARPMACRRDLLFNQHRLTCDFPANVDCGSRPKDRGDVSGARTCYSALVNVTVVVRNEVRVPQFQAKVQVRAQRQPLRYILLMAAGMDPRFRYNTRYFEGYGDYVSSLNGVHNDLRQHLAVWQPYNKTGRLITHSLDDYIPEDGDVVTFLYMDALG